MGFHLLLRFLPMFFGKRRREGKWKLSFHTLGSLVRRQDPGGITVTVVVIVVVILVTVVIRFRTRFRTRFRVHLKLARARQPFFNTILDYYNFISIGFIAQLQLNAQLRRRRPASMRSYFFSTSLLRLPYDNGIPSFSSFLFYNKSTRIRRFERTSTPPLIP